jgi:hypothetical protein
MTLEERFDAAVRDRRCADAGCGCHRSRDPKKARVHCPLHADEHPSLDITMGHRQVLFACRSQHCPSGEIARYFSRNKIWAEPDAARSRRQSDLAEPKLRLVAKYDYGDEDDHLLFQTLRYQPKAFKQRRPDGKGGWIWNLDGVRLVPYRLPELIAAPKTEWLFFPEGERDVETIRALGMVATTTPLGAGKWRDEYAAYFAGRKVAILEDNDAPGVDDALTKAKALRGIAAVVTVLHLPDLPAKGDVTDWIVRERAAGRTDPEIREALLRFAEEATPFADPESRDDARPIPVVSVEPFPVDILPGRLADYARAVARTMPCPIDYIGLSMVALAGSLIGGIREVAIKRGWREVPVIYAANVGFPGEKKTPAINEPVRIIRAAATAFVEDYKARKELFEIEVAKYEVAFAAWKKSAIEKGRGPIGDPPPKPAPPTCRRLIASDITVEALGKVLSENPRGIGVVRDELTGWVRSFNQYRGGRGADRQFYLSSWSGVGVEIDRKTQGDPIILPRPVLAILGGLPPDILRELSDERGYQDGLVHRIVFAYPDPVIDAWVPEDVSVDLEAAWETVAHALIALPDTTITRALSVEAMALWVEFQRAHHAEVADADFNPALRGPWRKYESYVLRVALILHELRCALGEDPGQEITVQDIRGGVAFVTWAKSHARKVYGFLQSSPADRQVEAIVAWILKNGEMVTAGKVTTRMATARKILMHHVAGVKKASEVRALFRDLADRRLGSVSGPRPLRFTLNLSGQDHDDDGEGEDDE